MVAEFVKVRLVLALGMENIPVVSSPATSDADTVKVTGYPRNMTFVLGVMETAGGTSTTVTDAVDGPAIEAPEASCPETV